MVIERDGTGADRRWWRLRRKPRDKVTVERDQTSRDARNLSGGPLIPAKPLGQPSPPRTVAKCVRRLAVICGDWISGVCDPPRTSPTP